MVAKRGEGILPLHQRLLCLKYASGRISSDAACDKSGQIEIGIYAA